MEKRRFFVLILTLFLGLAVFTGCNFQQARGNYDVFECMEKLDYTDDYDAAVKIIGFEGELIDERKGKDSYPYETFEWKLTRNTAITIRFSLSDEGDFKRAQITAEFPSKMVSNSDIDFSEAASIEKKVKSHDGLLYDEFVDMVGGVEGTKTSVSSEATEYVWVGTDGATAYAKFDNDGKCLTFSAVI